MNEVKKVYYVDGGYIVEFDDGYLAGIAAYENAEEIVERWADAQHVLLNSIHLVCGWDEADELLRKFGCEVELY